MRRSKLVRYTNADKQEAVCAALKAAGAAKRHNREIADEVGVGEWMVRKWRATLGIPVYQRGAAKRKPTGKKR